jgi:inner membrane transporter RhtA
VGSFGTVALRLFFAAAVLMALWRPSLRMDRRTWTVVLGYGVILGLMNLCFYSALARLPLGIAVTIEFLGPLAVAVLASHRALDLVWVALAGCGVALLADTRGEETQVLGIALAAAAGFFWALYIVLGTRVGARFPGVTGLAPAMVLGAVLIAPWGIYSAGHHLRDPQLVGAAVGVGLLSSALPWSLELEALRRLPTHVFGVVLSLEPAVAALAGFVFLGERLGFRSWLAIALVVAASAGAALEVHGRVAPTDV